MIFQRQQLQLVLKRVKEPRKFIIALLGPRQIGKTTLVRQLLKQITLPHLFVAADNIAATDTNWITQQWEGLRLKLKSEGAKSGLLVIDEIQKINNWSEEVKRQWDNDTFNGVKIKVIILGSSQTVLQLGLSESLAGRFEVVPMLHWSFTEMQQAFGFKPEEYVWYGGYPGAAGLIKDEIRWKEYILTSLIENTISKDILMLTRIDKPALLKRLFELGCAYSGQIVSFTKIVGQLQDAGNTTTLSHYLNLLDAAGMLYGTEKYANTTIRQKASIPKWQVQNPALFSVYAQHTFKEAKENPALWGRHVESAIGSYLLNQCKETGVKLYYWREGGDEVDFVLKKGNKLIGLEVKTGSKPPTKGMAAFQKNFKPNKIYLIENAGLKWQEFLKINIEDLF